MDSEAINNQIWPYVFSAPSMDRSQGSHMGNPDRMPWLCGIDGRHRGGLSSYLGQSLYGGSPIRKAIFKCGITDFTELSGDSVTFDGFGASSPVVLTAGSEWTAGSSNALTAASLESAIETAITTTAFPELLYVSSSVNSSTVTLTIYYLYSDTGSISLSNGTGWSWNPVSGLASDTTIDGTFELANNGSGIFPFAVDVDYAKYVEIRKTGNTIQRGFLVRDSATGWLIFFYNEAFGADAWTGAYFVDTTGDFANLRMSCTYLGRIGYVTGTDGSTSRQKVFYWDEDTSAHTTEDMGPCPSLLGTNLTDGLVFYADTNKNHISSVTQGGTDVTPLRYSEADITAIVWDATNEKVIYSDNSPTGGTTAYIYRMDADGSNHEIIVTLASQEVSDLYFDNTGNKLYALLTGSTGQVKRYDPDGSNETSVLATSSGYTGLERFTMDEANELLFFVDDNVKDISIVDISGSLPVTANPTNHTSSYSTAPIDVAYDSTNDRLYVIEDDTNDILAYWDATTPVSATAIDSNVTGTTAITIDNHQGLIYGNGSGKIIRWDLDGSREVTFLEGNLASGVVACPDIAVQEGQSSRALRPVPFGEFTVKTPTGGSLNGSNLSAGAYDFRVRYYDQRRRRYSPLSLNRPLFQPSITETNLDNGGYFRLRYANDEYFDPIVRDYDQIQFWSTTSSGVDDNGDPFRPTGTVYLRGTFDLPTTDYWHYEFGKSDVEDGTTDTEDSSGIYPDGFDQLTDGALAEQPFFNPITDYVTTVVPDLEQIHYYAGSNFGLAIEDGFLDIRWTPLDRIEPENWQVLNVKRTQIPALGVASFVEAGDYLWVLGDNESYRIQKVGAALSIHKKLTGYKFVGPHCATAVGSNIIAVTTTGVLNINANTGDYVQISALDRIILKRWSKNLETTGQDQPIQVEYDSRLGAVYIWNRRLGECAILWTTTNRVTFLTDCWFQYLTSGYLPNSRSDGRRIFWITETQAGSVYVPTISDLISPGGGFFLNPVVDTTDTPNMFGLDVSASTGEITFLVGEGFGSFSASEGESGNTYLQFEAGSSGDIEPGRLVGGTLHVLSGTLKGNSYKIIASTGKGDPSANRFKVYLNGTVTDLSADDIISICPVPVGIMGWPLGSRMFSQDMLSRRVVDAVNAILGTAAGSTVSTDEWAHFQYGLLRYEDTADDEVLDAVSDPTAEAATGFPWTNTWSADSANDYTIDTSTPSDGNTAGLYAPLEGDGGVLLPTFQCVVSGLRFSLLALYLQGHINPNDGVHVT